MICSTPGAAWRSTIAAWHGRRWPPNPCCATAGLRAGRSALLQGDDRTGKTLLDRADRLARQSAAPGVSAEVERVRKAAAGPRS